MTLIVTFLVVVVLHGNLGVSTLNPQLTVSPSYLQPTLQVQQVQGSSPVLQSGVVKIQGN